MGKVPGSKERKHLHLQYLLKEKNKIIKQYQEILDDYRAEIQALEWKNEQLTKRLNE